jgi:hypothetical protein
MDQSPFKIFPSCGSARNGPGYLFPGIGGLRYLMGRDFEIRQRILRNRAGFGLGQYDFAAIAQGTCDPEIVRKGRTSGSLEVPRELSRIRAQQEANRFQALVLTQPGYGIDDRLFVGGDIRFELLTDSEVSSGKITIARSHGSL